MTKPTPHAALYAWHTNALLGVLGDDHPTTEEPQCGFYKRRLVKGGVFAPARIWMYQPIDENGDLVGDEVMQCEVDGKFAEPDDQWIWLCQHPITEAEFKHLTALREWAQKHAPTEAYADPTKPVDWLRGVPLPTFSTKEAKT